jgi:hypothetical protein
MFAPPVAKARTKAAASPADKLAPRRSTLAAHRPGHDSVEDARLSSWDFSKIAVIAPDRPNGRRPIGGNARAMTGAAADEPGVADAGASPLADNLTPNLPGAPTACLVQAELPYSRSGIIRSSTGEVGERFEVRAEWSSAPPASRGESSYCAAECGEYHQFIKGHMRSSSNQDGSDLTDVGIKLFGGLALDEKQFREDGRDTNPDARYGHRSEKQTMDEKYEPDRLTGTKYIGKDFPRVMIGTFADIDITFRGDIVDTCNNDKTLMSDTWRVQYRGVIRP